MAGYGMVYRMVWQRHLEGSLNLKYIWYYDLYYGSSK